MEVSVGMRVVRGPDWKWGDQDHGEGGLGTVIGAHTDGWAVVLWDHGTQGDYRTGADEKYDVRLFDNATVGVIHSTVYCDGEGCKQRPLHGIRWKCAQCYDFDLCSDCFMRRRCHELSHAFYRINKPNDPWVQVPRRTERSPIPVKGIVAGATVIRGRHWEWKNQDGGSGTEGDVIDVQDWDEGSKRHDAVRVRWNNGHCNKYRLGYGGKVDLICKSEANYGHYYPDMLPPLGFKAKDDRGSLATIHPGDVVAVTCSSIKEFKRLQDGHGGWNDKMVDLVGKLGRVTRISQTGDVFVEIPGTGRDWAFNPAVLTKRHVLSIGDKVCVISNLERVKQLQRGHGEWAGGMEMSLGKRGEVTLVYPDGDVRVRVMVAPPFLTQEWTFNPACLEPLSVSRRRSESGQADVLSLLQHLMQPDSQDTGRSFFKAVSDGNAKRVREILNSDPHLCDATKEGHTALQLAAYKGFKEVMSILLDKGADIEGADSDGDTPLHLATYGREPLCAMYLLKRGARCNAKNKKGRSPLHVAASKGFISLVQILCDHGADVHLMDAYGDSPLHDSIAQKHDNVMDLLIRQGANLLASNKNGFPPLHLAARSGNAAAVLKILNHSSHLVNSRKDDGYAALHLAALNDLLMVAKVIVEQFHGDLNVVNQKNQTPLFIAVMEGHNTLVEYLVGEGADIDIADDKGNTPLHVSVMKAEFGQRDDISDPFGAALFAALRVEHKVGNTSKWVATASFLAHNGASLNIRNKEGKLPLDYSSNTVHSATILKFSRDSKKRKPPQKATSPTRSGDDGIRVTGGDGIRVTGGTADMAMNIPVMNQLSTPGGSEDGIRVAAQSVQKDRSSSEATDSGLRTCNLCESPADLCFFPCSHIALCKRCGGRAKRCSTCQASVQRKIELSTCLLCDNLAGILCMPCGHVTLCQECGERATKCSHCRAVVKEKWLNGAKL